MFADRRFRFHLLRAKWTLSQMSPAESRDEPSNRPEQDRQHDRATDLVLRSADEIANNGVDAAPENNRFHALWLAGVVPQHRPGADKG